MGVTEPVSGAHVLTLRNVTKRYGDVVAVDDLSLSIRDGEFFTIVGPSGSGKTTTVYACLRELVALFGQTKGLMSLEDPVEVVVPGVTQSQVRPHVGFDLATGLKSMMRQDPDVIVVGEIRDSATAETAVQAALTGHLVLTTFHAGSCADAVGRLLDMNVEPYLLRSTLRMVICQRLFRKLCDACTDKTTKSDSPCKECSGTGYFGRLAIAESLTPDHPDVASAILTQCDSVTLQKIAVESGMQPLRQRAHVAVGRQQTSRNEVFRVLGAD